MANTTVQSEQIEDGSITAAKLADGTIVAAELADNAVVTAAINADAVTGAKIADNAIDSEHYTDGSIDTAHIADAQITVGKMAANSVDSDQYVDGSIDTVHIADAQVTTAKITDGNISTGKIADNAVTSAKIDTNIDIAGTFDVTGATTLDSTLAVAGAATFNAGATFSGTVQPSSANGIDLGTNGTEFRTLYLDTSLIASNALTIATGTDLTIDAEGDITLDANGGDISFKDAGTEIGLLTNDSTNFGIFSRVNNADIKFYGLDDSSTINALTLDMSAAGAATFNSSVSAPNGFLGGTNGGLRIHSGGTKFFNITAANAARDAIMDIGAADARFKDIYLSGGVNFSANANASGMSSEILDDYEEGTWSPAFTSQSAGTGTYTKVGRLVTIKGVVTCDANGASSGAISMSGFPFSVDTATLRVHLAMDDVNSSAGGNNVSAPFNGQAFLMHDSYVRTTSTGSNPYYHYNLLKIGTVIYIDGSFHST